MTQGRWERAAEIFAELAELGRDERAAAWARYEDLEEDVRAEVESLLQAHEASEGYLEEGLLGQRRPAAGTQIGAWRLAEEVGQGGMSVVYRGERVEGGFTQRAAIKLIAVPGVMTAGLARQIQQRFEAERQIIARLEHPDICKLLDGGVTEDGVPYLVLEYVEGTDLLTYARQRPVEERIKLLARVARTVHYAHQRLVVHRDLKPSNILVTAEGHPKLLDFGIAKTLDPAEWGLPGDRTATVLRAATPGYASPEQLRGEALTTATDIYSLGVLARQLFQDAADEDLTAIAARATRDEPGERYSSAAALAADLERHLQGLPLEARQGNLRYVAMKFVRRHKVGVVAASVAVLFGMGFTAVTLVQKRQIERERARAASVAAFLQGLFRRRTRR